MSQGVLQILHGPNAFAKRMKPKKTEVCGIWASWNTWRYRDRVQEQAKRNIKCKDANVSHTQIWMNRFEQNGNNESTVAVIHAINVCKKEEEQQEKKNQHTHLQAHIAMYKPHIPSVRETWDATTRSGICRQFACFGRLILIARIAVNDFNTLSQRCVLIECN